MESPDNDDSLALKATGYYPSADISPSQFERVAAEFCRAAIPPEITGKVRVQHRLNGLRGSYVFDFTIEYDLMGMHFLVLGEAKRHADPIKRDVVQVLHTKLEDVGAQKGVIFTTSRFQSGALSYARTANICLVRLTEGRFLYETKTSAESPAMTREDAWNHFGLPTYAGHVHEMSEDGESIWNTLLTHDHVDPLREFLLRRP